MKPNSLDILQVEDLKEQLGARADSEYALQEENRRLQVKNDKKETSDKNEIQTLGGGDEGELREEETEHGE